MQQTRIQYVKSADGAQIAYTSVGHGFPIVVPANNWGDIEMLTMSPVMAPALSLFTAAGFRLWVYDGRGAGSSDRHITDFSLAARLGDLRAVVDRLRLSEFHLMGNIHGCSTAIAYAAEHPERVSRMVLFGPYPSGAGYYAGTPMLRAVKILSEIADEYWEFFTLTLASWLTQFTDVEATRRVAEIYRRTMDPADYRRMIAACEQTDVTEYLPQVRAATLVIKDSSQRVSLFPDTSRTVAAGIPGAQLFTSDDWPEMARAAVEFLRGDRPEPPSRAPVRAGDVPAFRTVLFTDLVGHTEMMTHLGDEKGREVLREHERITREVLAANGGTEVKTMGDGFMASFGSVTKAVECAIALQRAMEAWKTVGATGRSPLQVRVGLNAGEPIEEEGDLFGATVILASRIAAKARGGEILVSDNVRSLSAGKGFLFADRGEFTAKGFEEPVRIYEVNWAR